MDMSSRWPAYKHREPPDRRLFDLIDGRFMPIREIGCGAVCLVHLAEDMHTGGRPVAVKRLRNDMRLKANARHSLKTEAKALSLVNHSGIPKLISSSLEGADPYVAEEFKAGRNFSLNNIRDIKKSIELTISVLNILGTLHAAGIVHRDVKPSNLALGFNLRTVSLLDFGFSIVPGIPDIAMQVDIPVGTPMFMAPEQTYRHARVDRSADLYSVGIILFILASGWYPYDIDPKKNEREEYVRCHRSANARLLHTLKPGISGQLSYVVSRAICKEPEGRYTDAESMADALSDCLAELLNGY